MNRPIWNKTPSTPQGANAEISHILAMAKLAGGKVSGMTARRDRK